MKIKITQAGWEGFTGDLGSVEFVDGVSLDRLSKREAMALGAHVSIVELDDAGDEVGPVSPSHELLLVSHLSAPVVVELSREPEPEIEGEPEAVPAPTPDVTLPLFIQEELEAIASAKGIAGLREIGDKLDVRDTSVRGLIAKILNAQSNPKTEA